MKKYTFNKNFYNHPEFKRFLLGLVLFIAYIMVANYHTLFEYLITPSILLFLYLVFRVFIKEKSS